MWQGEHASVEAIGSVFEIAVGRARFE